MTRRLIVQLTALVLANPFPGNFLNGTLYRGSLKGFCVPFLNCFSCPAAVASCPLGAIQNVLAAPFTRIPFYVVGFMVVVGALAGRWVCGWLCPFGFIQELMGRLSRFKKSIPPWLAWTTLTKYLLLILLFILPVIWVDASGYGSPYFCQFICPKGTLSAGIPLILSDPGSYAPLVGTIFWVKIFILGAVLVGSILVNRPFCRLLCPLGAFWGLFNRFSFFRLHLEEVGCNSCGRCEKICPVDLQLPENRNSRECVRCLICRDACPRGALSWGCNSGG